MLAARATGSVRSSRPAAALAAAASRAAPRAFSAKSPDKPVPTPEEEAAKQAEQMRALDIVLEAQNNTGEPAELRQTYANVLSGWGGVLPDWPVEPAKQDLSREGQGIVCRRHLIRVHLCSKLSHRCSLSTVRRFWSMQHALGNQHSVRLEHSTNVCAWGTWR